MADDLDSLLRRSMKTLDDQVPSGYFDALPDRVTARLAGEEANMQHTSGTTNREAAPSGGVPPVATRDEDSGLHDIRNLAQSTKQRLSSKRITTSPPASDDDVLSTSSASWRNVALPQPANMVSLPAIEDLPSKQEIKAQEKAAKKAAKVEAPVAPVPAAPAPVAAAVDPSASQQAAFAPAFSSFAQRAKPSHRGRNLALAGMGLAAAAGIGIFVMTQKNGASDKAPAPTVAQAAPAETRSIADKSKELEEATAKLQAQRAAAAEQAAKDEAAANAAAAAGAAEPPPEPAIAAPVTKGAAPAKHAKAKADTVKVKIEDTAKQETPKPEAKDGKKAKPEPGDPSFDELLKEAGVDQKKVEKPKLDKKQLSGDDFKKGMSAVEAKAQACFKGTQGTAAVKLTVAPSGQVSKVTVGGVFAGKPEAACVSAAVKGAQFPPWDGGPQSFGYPILLSE